MTLEGIEFITQPKKGRVEISGNSRVEYNSRKIGISEVDSDEIGNDEIEKKGQKRSKPKKLSKSKKIVGSLDFLILRAKLVFTKLRQAFVKALIFYHFNLKCHI